MEFSFNINNLFGHQITKLDRNVIPYRTSPAQIRDYKTQICQVIDKMGDLSSKAQGLHGAITSASKLQMSDHNLYVMKDAEVNGGRGAIVGFIKTGHKRLFVYDSRGTQYELEPLCTLDFYVHESRQRMGCGKKLFEFMIREEGLKPHQVVIDRPSHKFLAFLQKHYHLKATVPQVNNFVVFDGFFRDKPASAVLDRRKRRLQKAPLHPYKHQETRSKAVESSREKSSRLNDRPPSGSTIPMSTLEKERAGQAGHYESSYGAFLPKRFSSLSLLAWDEPSGPSSTAIISNQKEVLSNVPIQRQFSSESNSSNHSDQRIPSANRLNHQGIDTESQAYKAMGAHSSMYSRHGDNTQLPPSRQYPLPNGEETRLDVSKTVIGGKAPEPPLLRRDGPSADYMRFLQRDVYNTESYQRGGHLKVSPLVTSGATQARQQPSPSQPNMRTSPQKDIPGNLPPGNPYNSRSAHPQSLSSHWNVFGVPPNPKSANSAQKLQTRLW